MNIRMMSHLIALSSLTNHRAAHWKMTKKYLIPFRMRNFEIMIDSYHF
jgi:hypothetical protein